MWAKYSLMTFVDDRRVYAAEGAEMFIGTAGVWTTLMRVAVPIKVYLRLAMGSVR